MIYLARGEAPSDFANQSQMWLDEFQQESIQNPQLTASNFWTRVRNRKSMEPYAKQLSKVFHRKCVYCESLPEHVSASNIDHYFPKGIKDFEHLMFSWDNWLLTCAKCNTFKGAYYEEYENVFCIINPSSEKPEDHIGFLNAQIIPYSTRGDKSISRLRLGRSDLVDARAKWLLQIRSLLIILLRVPEAAQSARQMLIWAMQDNAPYAAMTRTYLSKKTPKLAHPAQPHPILELDEPIRQIEELINHHSEQLEEVE